MFPGSAPAAQEVVAAGEEKGKWLVVSAGRQLV
jgi:hypothetical protein